MIIWWLGVGIFSLPYLAARNGIMVGVLLLIFGASVSYFWGMLLVYSAEKTNSNKYEDIAKHWYGKGVTILTGWCNISTLLGFVISYIIFIKTLIPQIFNDLIGEDNLPDFLQKEKWKGEFFGQLYIH